MKGLYHFVRDIKNLDLLHKNIRQDEIFSNWTFHVQESRIRNEREGERRKRKGMYFIIHLFGTVEDINHLSKSSTEVLGRLGFPRPRGPSRCSAHYQMQRLRQRNVASVRQRRNYQPWNVTQVLVSVYETRVANVGEAISWFVVPPTRRNNLFQFSFFLHLREKISVYGIGTGMKYRDGNSIRLYYDNFIFKTDLSIR